MSKVTETNQQQVNHKQQSFFAEILKLYISTMHNK